MATSRRGSAASLIERLRASPESFEFLQAVRIFERAAALAVRETRVENPGRVGLDEDPRSEAVYLRAALELAFPTGELSEFDGTGKRPQLSVTVMGLNGPSGVLPLHYSELVMTQLRQKNKALRDFFDLFNHRTLSLFARAMEKYRLPLIYERAGRQGVDAISSAVYGLIGMHGSALRQRQAVPDAALLFYAGHFAHRPRTAGALAQMLSEYFGQPVKVAQFQGRWVSLAESEQTVLGAGGRDRPVSYARLGVDAVIGSRIWDVQGSFRVRLGPLDYDELLSFMPNGAQMAELAALTRSYAGPALSFDVQLTLKTKEIPPLQLMADQKTGPRLGWNTWLPKEAREDDASDAVFRMEAV